MTKAPSPSTPLRLTDAIAFAFPFGGMTVSGLRREAARGRLQIERIAGKDFTTLAAIEAMRVLCRLPVDTHPPSRRVAIHPTPDEKAWARLPDRLTKGQSLSQAAFLHRIAERRGK